jgi:hypothetical protein
MSSLPQARALLALALWLLIARSARADSTVRAGDAADHYELSARSDTFAELFRRALLPGPNGSLVASDTVAPVFEYVFIHASDLDTAWRKDSLDFELAAWGSVWFGPRNGEQPLDGDIQLANARYRQGPIALRVGRQQIAGGAARFVRFDGAELTAELGAGLDASIYSGFSVLPRWNEQRRYEQLGAAVERTAGDAPVLDSSPRSKYWVSGGRLGFHAGERRAGISFHEQREPGGVAHRNLGLDGRLGLIARLVLGANAIVDLDRRRFADARLWLDTSPAPFADLSFEYLHTEPSLFLSHQSVLSVFGSAAYDEAGGYATLRAGRALAFDGSGFVQVYAGGRPGARGELSARAYFDSARSSFVRLAYARVQSPDNGYHSLRSSLARRFTPRLSGTLEAYAYLYDQAIRGYRASTVYAGTLSYEPAERLSLLLGASLSHSPYASLDAQTTLRASYTFDFERGRAR